MAREGLYDLFPECNFYAGSMQLVALKWLMLTVKLMNYFFLLIFQYKIGQ